MENGLIRVGKIGNIILFVILEFIAFYLIITFNNEQKAIFLHSTNLFSSSIYERFDNINQYFSLSEVADSLSRSNARLKQKGINYKYLRYGKSDTIFIKDTTQFYTVTPATIKSLSINRRNNNIVIDKGTNQGIRDGMGVMGENGIVGKTRLCTQNFCSIIPVIHSQSSISVAIKNKNFFGSLVWEDTNPQIHSLQAIPKHANIEPGDTVITSGYSFLFPRGVTVGIVKEASVPSGSNFYNIKVRLINTLSNTEYVYVIQNLYRSEIDSLMNIDE